jgi:hypothetical protein
MGREIVFFRGMKKELARGGKRVARFARFRVVTK